MNDWNDTENTELSGEVTEGYFGESSDKARDAPGKRHPRRKKMTGNTESAESRYGFRADEITTDTELSDHENTMKIHEGDPAAFTESDTRIFTPDSKRSFVESRRNDEFSDNPGNGASKNTSSSKTRSDSSKSSAAGSKSSADKKKEYRRRLKAKAKEKQNLQRKMSEDEAGKDTDPAGQTRNDLNPENVTADDTPENYYDGESRINLEAETFPDIKDEVSAKEISRSAFENWDDRDEALNTCNSVQDTDSGIFTHHHETGINPDSNRDSGRKSIKPRQPDTQKTKKNITVGYEGNGVFYADPGPKGNNKKTSLNLFGSDDISSSDTGRHRTSRQSVEKLSGTGMKAADYSIHKAGSAISRATGEKDDNSGADALRLAEQGGETVSRYGFYVAGDLKDKAFEESTKTVKKVSDYTTDSIFETAKKELSKEEKKKLAYRKALNRKRKQAARKAKKAAKEAGKKTYEGAKDTAKVAKAVVKTVLRTVFAIPRAILIILLILLVLLLFGGEMAGSVISLTTEAASILSTATYQSSPQMIDQADLEFSYMELMLRDQIDEIEDDYPDYDEYSYTLGSIGHDPYTLINYLHAEFGTINSDAMACLTDLYNAMYELKLTPVEETRYRLVPKPPEEDEEEEEDDEDDSEDDTEEDDEEDDSGETEEDDGEEDEDEEEEEPEYIVEEYTVNILKVELISRSLESIVEGRLSGNPTGKAIYAILNKTHGLVQYIGSPVFYTWSVESYYGYRRNPYGNYPELHRGLDIRMPAGTTVQSAITGFVKEIGSDPMFGDYVVIEDDRYTVKYASMGHISVIVDSLVHRGQTVGYTGSSGSEPPGLHMELLVNGTYYNPLFYTENPQPETD